MRILLLLFLLLPSVLLAQERTGGLITADHIAIHYFNERWISLSIQKEKEDLSPDELGHLESDTKAALTYAFQIFILLKHGTRFEDGNDEKFKFEYQRGVSRLLSLFTPDEVKHALRGHVNIDAREHTRYMWSVPDYSIKKFDKDFPEFLKLCKEAE